MIFGNMITRTFTDEERARSRCYNRRFFITYCVLLAASGGVGMHDYLGHKLTWWLVVQVLMFSMMTMMSYFQMRKTDRLAP